MENLKFCPLCVKNSRKQNILAVEKCGNLAEVFPFLPQKSKEESEFARGDCSLDFVQCLECGFIYNQSFDLEKAMQGYEDKACYQTKQNRSINLAMRDKILSLAKKESVFLEIAPGQGDLVRALSEKANYIYSVDPSPSSNCIADLKNVTHIQGFFNIDLIRQNSKHTIDFIIFRHLLEHLDNPRSFLENVVDLLEDGGMIYVEVPNTTELFKHAKFYEFYHDHFGYFQKNLLINIMSGLGCEFLECYYPHRGEQFMGLFFRKKLETKICNLTVEIYTKEQIGDMRKAVKNLNEILSHYENIGIYGGGFHANSFLYYMNDTNVRKVRAAFDINPEKIGRFLQNSDIQIKRAEKENLKECDCLLMATCLFEERVVKEEIFPMVNQGLWGGGAYPHCKKIA